MQRSHARLFLPDLFRPVRTFRGDTLSLGLFRRAPPYGFQI
jgi:hypothetical protein